MSSTCDDTTDVCKFDESGVYSCKTIGDFMRAKIETNVKTTPAITVNG